MPRRRVDPRPKGHPPDHVAWTDNFRGSFIFQLVPESERPVPRSAGSSYSTYEPEPGDDATLILPTTTGTFMYFRLTDMTVNELDKLKHIIDLAFNAARPISARRDENAANTVAEGREVVYDRSYRVIPTFFVRPGIEPKYGSGIQQGSEELPRSSWRQDQEERVQSERNVLADSIESDTGTQDRRAAPDQLEVFRPMGGNPSHRPANLPRTEASQG